MLQCGQLQVDKLESRIGLFLELSIFQPQKNKAFRSRFKSLNSVDH